MPSTGRLYMRVDGATDERRDPIRIDRSGGRAPSAATTSSFGSWPLAITAYNHRSRGHGARATSELEHPGHRDHRPVVQWKVVFGFASRNFYAEVCPRRPGRRRASGSPLGGHPSPRGPTGPRGPAAKPRLRLREAARQTGVARERLIRHEPGLPLDGDPEPRTSIPRGHRCACRKPCDARVAMAHGPGRIAGGDPGRSEYVIHTG